MEQTDEEIKKKVEERLGRVIDPETMQDVMTMELILNLEVKEGHVSLAFRPSAPTCPLAITLAFGIRRAVESVEGVKSSHIEVIDHVSAIQVTEIVNE
jgi:metal-sulfur cluster biosynthetic enzyme